MKQLSYENLCIISLARRQMGRLQINFTCHAFNYAPPLAVGLSAENKKILLYSHFSDVTYTLIPLNCRKPREKTKTMFTWIKKTECYSPVAWLRVNIVVYWPKGSRIGFLPYHGIFFSTSYGRGTRVGEALQLCQCSCMWSI